jgi:hypothetical protein
MSDEYTPTTEPVRGHFAASPMAPSPREFAREAFDRWLAARDREVAAKAWDEGARHVYTEGGKCSFARDGDPCPYNPYREGSR